MNSSYDPRPSVRASLQKRIWRAQMPIDEELAPELACLRYEHELAQRLLAKATAPEAREVWEIEASVLHDLAAIKEGEIEEEHEQIARYKAMVAEIDVDLEGKL